MTAFCGLYITSECFGQIQASQDGMYNGRPQYFFSITYNGNLINAWIYWSPDDNSWFVQDLSTNQNISYLPFDRVHPNGTYLEWENVSLLSYGCLTNSTSFETDWFSECPPTYFEFCCPKESQPENFIGLQSFEYYGYIDSVFYLESPQFSGCATVIEGPIPSSSVIYNSVDLTTQYDRCNTCTGSTQPCYSQPIYTTPTPISPLTADTGCGVNYVLVNECQVITVSPLSVLCSVTNVSTYGGNDGSIELLISGGTPPYTISWDNGYSTPIINNLISGSYRYTVTDYYGDFTVSNACSVGQLPMPTPVPNPSNFCLTVNIDGQIFKIQFEPFLPYTGGIPAYKGYDANGEWVYDLVFYTDSLRWMLDGPITAGDLVNYDPSYPPLNGWEWLNPGIGIANGVVGDCQNNGNFCMTINVDSFATQPYKIYFNEYGEANGKPMWIDNLDQYQISWSENSQNSSWILQGLPEYATFTLINSNPSIPPTNQWFVNGKNGEAIITYDNCFSSTICATISDLCETESIELVSGELINGQQSWSGQLPCGNVGTWSIYYDNVNNQWVTDGLDSVATNDAINYNNVYLGPFGYYNTNGYYNLFVTDGNCNSQGNLKMVVTYNDPISDSDGGIVLEVEGGNPPYQYSIDNGTTYQNFPIFSNLKFGTYVVTVKDVNGLIIKQSIILQKPPQIVTYEVSLNTTSRRTVNTVTTTTVEYTTTLKVTPPLPSGVTINFNLTHNDVYKVSPSESASSLTLGTILLKNNEEISIDDTITGNYTYSNTLLSCQSNLVYVTATTNDWYNLSVTYGDNIIITTTVTNVKNGKYPCYLAENNELYSLSNLRINGCSNCKTSNQDSPPPISQTPTKTPTPTPTPSKPATTSPGI